MPTLAEDRDAIRDLFARYCLYVDTGKAEDFAACFTDDGEFNAAGNVMTGAEAIKGFASTLSPGMMHHMVVNEVIDVDGDTANCRASILVTAGGALAVSGRYEDVLRRVDGNWRIARRTFTPDGAPPQA